VNSKGEKQPDVCMGKKPEITYLKKCLVENKNLVCFQLFDLEIVSRSTTIT